MARITKRTVVDQVEVTTSGVIQVRFGLQLVEGDVIIDQKWHRTIIEPGISVDLQMALVNKHLDGMGKAQVGAPQLQELKVVVAAVHTEEKIAGYRAAQQRASEATDNP